MRSSKKSAWKVHLLAFVLPFVGMAMVMLICGYRPFGTGKAMLYSDNYHQYFPFFAAFRRALRSGGSLLYSWDVGMGVDYLGMIAYYLASPLNLLSVLVPDGWVLDYFCLLTPIRLGLAGLFFSLFLSDVFDRQDGSLAVFGGFYALCAWALGYQWNVMWLDTFALLPLVMLGMVHLLRDKKFVLYTLALALSVGSNYYIGFFTCIFVFLSFFCYEISEAQGWKRFFGDLLRIAFFSMLAIGMTAALTLSAFAALQTTQSSVNKFPTDFRLNIASSHTVLGLLGAMRTVAGNMTGGLEPTFKEGLPNLYCGVGTLLLAFVYLLLEDVKPREKLCTFFLLVFFNVSFIIRQLDYVWHGFHFPNMIPYRFSFLYSFVLLYMAYRTWTNRRKVDGLQVMAAVFLTAAVICCSQDFTVTRTLKVGELSADVPVYIIYNVGFLVTYAVILLWSSVRPRTKEGTEEELARIRHTVRVRRRRCRNAALAVMVLELAATLTCFGCFFPGTNVTAYPKGGEQTASMIRYMHEREEDTLFFRAETTHSQTLNDGALNGYSGVSAFTSSANVRVTEFMRALGYGAKNTYNRYCFEESSPVSNLFLNLKYMIDRDGRDRSSSYFSQVHRYGQAVLYRNDAYLPLGFLADIRLQDLDISLSDGGFRFQNMLFRAATGLEEDVFSVIEPEYTDLIGNGATVSEMSSSGSCTWSEAMAGSNVVYSFVANRDGFACVRLDLPKRNDFYILVNGTELYRETISLPQMLAVADVQAGDIIDIRILCKEGENGSATVTVAILDNDLFRQGYEILSASCLELTEFTGTVAEGTIDCGRDGLLYTSIAQNGNWKAYVDGEEAPILLIGDCMIGVELSRGQHTVRFEYENAAFRLGTMVSAGSLLMFLLAVLLSCRKKKAVPEQQSEKKSELSDMPKLCLAELEIPQQSEAAPPESFPERTEPGVPPESTPESTEPNEPPAEET